MPRKAKRKHERNISEYWNKTSHYFQINISRSENGSRKAYTKTVNCDDYASDADAFEAAILLRNQMLTDIKLGRLRNDYPTVEEVWQKLPELMPTRKSTVDVYQTYYKNCISKYASKRIDQLTGSRVFLNS